MEQLLVTDQEKLFILKRRELAEKRKQTAQLPPHQPKQEEKPKDVILGENRPKGWDSHCDPAKVHKGRITQTHPLYWFEDEIFKRITNLQHKEQHSKISKILCIPVQNVFRDRVYHALSHLDALWEQGMLPVKYKVRYEDFKEQHGIGDDNVHPAHKELKPDFKHPVANKKRPWDKEKYPVPEKDEVFLPGKKYYYDYDKEIGYKYTE